MSNINTTKLTVIKHGYLATDHIHKSLEEAHRITFNSIVYRIELVSIVSEYNNNNSTYLTKNVLILFRDKKLA